MATILSLALLSVMAAPQFDDPALRGAPFETEHSYIPEVYLGEWAEKLSACGKPVPPDHSVVIETMRFNGAPIRSVWAYSDYPAIILATPNGAEGGRSDRLHLDISHDELWLRLRRDGGGKTSLLRRCPTSAVVKRAGTVERKRLNDFCAIRDRDGFIEAFFSSPATRYFALSKQISIIRGDALPKRWPRRYYRLPPIKFAPHAVYYEYGTERSVPIIFEPVSDADRGFHIEWKEDPNVVENRINNDGSDYRYTAGIRGRLSFAWSNGCWKLVSDEIRWSEWP